MAVPDEPILQRGQCLVMLAFDVGQAIDLDEAERRLTQAQQRERIPHRRRTPKAFQFSPAPLRVMLPAASIAISGLATDPMVEFLLFDFGAVSASFRVPLSGPLSGLIDLADALYENEALLEAGRQGVEGLVAQLGPAVRSASVARLVEDYAAYHIAELRGAPLPEEVLASHGALLARVLRAERGPLSAQETADALAERVSYGPGDAAVIDWNASVLLDDDAEDLLTVLEFVNVELLEMRVLDEQLDRLLDRSYEAMARPGLRHWLSPASPQTRRIARLQSDSALLFESVNNAIKLVGDQYLARVYRCASRRLHLPEWDASILRKLQTVESIYSKLADQQAARRMEVLEWIIIVLIAVSIAIVFLPGH